MYRKLLFVIFILILLTHGCGLFSSKSSDAEAVFAATEVGTPEGDKVAKDIGPAGGTLASPDGRLTLTVPQNALTEMLPFSIQPITNKAGGGLGIAYRLEPNGKTFTTPLEISVHYDEHDLEGTVAEALFLAYQDQQGAWHAQKSARLDQTAATLTISTTHFTDFTLGSRFQLRPNKRTLYVGESQYFVLAECKVQSRWDELWSRRQQCSPAIPARIKWELRGQGTIAESVPGLIYTAPAKKPSPNKAFVVGTVEMEEWESENGVGQMVKKLFSAEITILDRGYRATGQTGDTVYSGTICDLESPFTITGKNPVITYPLKFEPSSATAGTMSLFAAIPFLKVDGSGSYKIEGAGTEKPRIAITASSTGTTPKFSLSGGGTFYIDLAPLEGKECQQQ